MKYLLILKCSAKNCNRKIKETECAYFISYVRDSNLTEPRDRVFPCFSWAFIVQQFLFEPNDGILNQLRNSGELRYFKNPELQAAVGKLSVAITNTSNRNDRGIQHVRKCTSVLFHTNFMISNGMKLFVNMEILELYEALNQNVKAPVKGKILNLDKFNRQETENLVNPHLQC